MERRELLYEGKAKQVYATDDVDKVIIHYKDDATAFNGEKKEQIEEKGVLNNRISEIIFLKLAEKGIQSHFIKRLNERDALCYKVNILPLEVIVRNVIAGSMAKRLNIEEGTTISNTIFEICYKEDSLGDPLINDHHAVALGICSYEDLSLIYAMTSKINDTLIELFDGLGVKLIDFKIEFGRLSTGEIILADEISPDTCRFWDKETNEKLDKDRFRRDLGGLSEAYQDILARLSR